LEPFGLLNLLKTLLPNEPTKPPEEEEPQANAEQPSPQEQEPKQTENACAAFLEAHERRRGKR